MSKLTKFFLIFGGLWVLTGLALAFAWYGPLPKLDWTVNRAFMKVLLESPEGLSSLRILEPAGIRFHQDDLDDASMEAGDRSLESPVLQPQGRRESRKRHGPCQSGSQCVVL